MKKMIVFIKKKEGMTFEDFRNHYENVHVPLCGERIKHLIQDFRRYYPQNLNNLYHGRPDAHAGREGGTSYDAIAVYTIKDERHWRNSSRSARIRSSSASSARTRSAFATARPRGKVWRTSSSDRV